MADYVWARDGQILGAQRVAGTDADEVEALPGRAIARYLRQGLISLKGADAAPPVAGLWQSNADNTAILPADMADSWVVGSDRMDRDTTDANKSTRTFFNKIKGAFRSGYSSTADWDAASIGQHSFASGENTKASGQAAYAEGSRSVSSGSVSHAEGYFSAASGAQSHAEGKSTKATGDLTHAEGNTTEASGYGSHAEGGFAAAVGTYSHAEGNSTRAGGQESHAEGTSSQASGYSAHAEGNASVASGNASHAEGNNTRASGNQSHAEGAGSIASGQKSHAEGDHTHASAWDSHAGGSRAVTNHRSEFARSSGRFAADGDAQEANMVILGSTTDATPKVLTSALAPLTDLQYSAMRPVLTLRGSRAFQLKISTVARRTDVQGEMAGWTWEGLVGRDSTGNARIIGTPVTNRWGDAAAAAWTLGVSINTTDATNNYVAVTATGELLKTIRWVAKLEWVEVGG